MLKKLCISLGLIFSVFSMSMVAAQQDGYWQPDGYWQQSLEQQRRMEEEQRLNQERQQWEENNRNAASKATSNAAGSQGGFASAPKVTVVNRFGAVALNADGSAFGFSSNQSSKIEAAQGAVSSCAQPGCRVVGTYANTCAAFAWGKLNHGGLTRLESGVTKEIAEASALEACNKKAKNCQILMSECSKL